MSELKYLNLSLNKEMAKMHVFHLRGDKNAQVTIQVFRDCKKTPGPNKPHHFHGTIDDLWPKIIKLNQNGYGIFIMVNKGDLNGRKKENVKSVSAYFFDQDGGVLPELPIKPTFIIQSKNGVHGYFVAIDGQSLLSFERTQKIIAKYLNTDQAVCDLPRVMRLAGTYHLKNIDDPFLVYILEANENKFDELTLLIAHADTRESFKEKKTEKSERSEDDTSQVRLFSSFFKSRGIKKNPKSFDFCTFFDEMNIPYAIKANDRIDVQCPNYTQHSSEFRLDSSSSLLIKHGRIVAFKCQHSHCTELNLSSILEKIDIEIIIRHCTKSVSANPKIVAHAFQESFGAPIRFYRDDWYFWEQNKYVPKQSAWVNGMIVRYIQEQKIPHSSISAFSKSVMLHLQGIGIIPFTESPFWIDQHFCKDERLISLKSHLFRVDEYLKTSESKTLLIPNCPKYFTLTALEYDYDPLAKSEIWLNFLNEMVPDEDLQRGIQEFFGLCLTKDSSFNIMAFFKGEGANGKSVILTVLRCMLGKENVSAVGLEAFSPVRTFPLAATMGKYANIVAELGEVSKAEEGVLKQYISGDFMTIERKHRDPIEMIPTAKLVFATNNLPHFRDKSDALFRRIFLIPMNVQILDPSKQDRRLVDPSFWESSGELHGVFNWALVGLSRLLKRNYWHEPRISILSKSIYRKELNPASRFLEENIVVGDQVNQICTADLYEAYSSWCKMHGYSKQSDRTFCDEVRRKFPEAEYSSNARVVIRIKGQKIRSRVWSGIKVIDSISFSNLLSENYSYNQGKTDDLNDEQFQPKF